MQITEEWVARFNEKWKLDESTGCWMWMASTHSAGYGQIKIPKQRRQIPAHRLSYLIHKGGIPAGLQVCHRCDTPRCVNPEHLFAGTSADNHADMKDKGRHLKGARSPNATLTEPLVKRLIEMACSGVSQTKVAAEFGVSQVTVSRIVRGLRWAHVNDSPKPSQERAKPLSQHKVRQIKVMLAAGVEGTKIAKAFDVSTNTVSRIKLGYRWKDVDSANGAYSPANQRGT